MYILIYGVLRHLISNLHFSLFFRRSSPIPLSIIYSFMPLRQFFRGPPCFLFPPGFHCSTCFGNLASDIPYTCPIYINNLSLKLSMTLQLTSMISHMLRFVAASILALSAGLLQKSISVADRILDILFFFIGQT